MDGTWQVAARTGIRRSISIGSTLTVLALGMFVVTRRLNGDLRSPTLPLLVATAAILATWACCLRFTASGAPATASHFWLPLLAILLYAIGLSYPGARVADWLIWSAASAVFAIGPRRIAAIRRGTLANRGKRRGRRLIQDLKRYRSADGRESVRGTLAAEFPPGQRSEILWVGFCPPFQFLPQVTAHAIEDTAVDVRVAHVLHNGAQLEVRLRHPARCQQVTNVELLAAESDPS